MSISEERKRILKMVEEGKLSADVAFTMLEELETDFKAMEQKHESFVNELSTEVNGGDGGFQQKSKSKNTSTSMKDTVLDFVDQALKKIKDIDLDFNFGSSFPVNHIFQHSNVDMSDVDIDVANGSVKLIPWIERDVRIDCMAQVYQVETTEEARKTFLQDVLFTIEGDKLRYSVQNKKMKVNATIYLPNDVYESITVRLFNGMVDGERLRIKSFKAKTANGKITMDGIDTDKLEVETANGHITLTNLTSQKVEAETINGTIKLDGSYKLADLQSFNGNINCGLIDAKCETLLIKSTTGNVDVYVPKERSLHGTLRTNIGNLHCHLASIDRKEEKSEVVQKYLKFKSTFSDEKELLLIDIATKTGSVVIQEKGGI